MLLLLEGEEGGEREEGGREDEKLRDGGKVAPPSSEDPRQLFYQLRTKKVQNTEPPKAAGGPRKWGKFGGRTLQRKCENNRPDTHKVERGEDMHEKRRCVHTARGKHVSLPAVARAPVPNIASGFVVKGREGGKNRAGDTHVAPNAFVSEAQQSSGGREPHSKQHTHTYKWTRGKRVREPRQWAMGNGQWAP